MRRKRLGVFIALSLFSWVLVSCFLFFYCPNCEKDEGLKPEDDVTDAELRKLESNIELLKNDYVKLINEIKKSVMKRKASILLNKLKQMQDNKNAQIIQEEINQNKGMNDGLNERLSKDENIVMKENIFNGNLIKGNMNIQENVTALDIKMRKIAKRELPNGGPVIAVLVFSCNRVTVKRCLDQLLKWRPSKDQFPIIVSQDCHHQATTEVILSYGDQITLIQQPDQSEIPIPPKEKKFKGYFKIARHYGWALNQTFFNFKFDTAIIVEDDLDISPDFFEYFLGTYWLLKQDPTLWCVSAWNDNGKSGLVDESKPDLLYRTDFFPGLGWMLTSSLWAELSVKWPKSYWDDWIRKPEQRKDRACIRPELPRTKTFGKIGVSNGMFYEKHLKYIKLNEQTVSFTKMNLSYLLKDNYDVLFVKDVYGSPVVSYQELKNGPIVSSGPVRIPYYTKDQYKKTAKFVGLMDDFRVSGVPIPSRCQGQHNNRYSNPSKIFERFSVGYKPLGFSRSFLSLGLAKVPHFTLAVPSFGEQNEFHFIGNIFFQSGVPRTAYRGVVTFSYKGRRVYLAPHSNWKAYDITWS